MIMNISSSDTINLHHVHVRLNVASSFCVVLITSYQVLDCNLDEINKGRHCQQARYHGHWELPIWIHRQSQMVLLTLFAGDGGYNPQLQRVGEGETFLHGYLTIHVIINATHNTCNFNTYCRICQKSLFNHWLFRWRPPETSPTWRAGSVACMTRRYLSTSIPYWPLQKWKERELAITPSSASASK